MAYQEIVQRALRAGRKLLPEHEAYEICKEFDIPFPPGRIAGNWEEAQEAGEDLGFPLVLKIVSPEVIHKSDVGGVLVGIASPADLKRAYDQLLANVREKAGEVPIDGVLVQKAMPKGVEVAVGGLRDEVFGPMIMFGSGGILIEVFKDVSFRMAPFDQGEALRQIQDTKAYELLKGFRGAPPSDLEALTQLIVHTGNLMCRIPELAELDFNPVLAYPEGCVVVDARMILSA
ncbi:acetyl-CoA synthetase (ADP-forming) [Syntrophus gentianae]|uniref:Acetyl-CoA synthetase (ADP-forming) n=1 Tax=Syntrophus gentianae TaxID=43775 RepID=A0A1H7UZL4_9BACT|nr:acetate--CoA ligase family protein [Syntrophus gentianae]SEM02068.1 acetyl-CoA synthetase (ADP-forming) [Syntrophus gentianae]